MSAARSVMLPAGGKPRLCGVLELSRALGDLAYRGKGLVAEPEASGPWALDDILRMAECGTDATVDGPPCSGQQQLQGGLGGQGGGGARAHAQPAARGGTAGGGTAGGALLVLASDGIYEALTPQAVRIGCAEQTAVHATASALTL